MAGLLVSMLPTHAPLRVESDGAWDRFALLLRSAAGRFLTLRASTVALASSDRRDEAAMVVKDGRSRCASRRSSPYQAYPQKRPDLSGEDAH
jgi:hypothetical protein